ncbi:hypothetical protein DdX_18935 [Ditylenchus destructor]|uniref:Uncharacterized protein n=1 Tax=Ditylenchus destructor TaxID=166010 RepID=A0AAD4QUI2_9BILA|nr:hypothetical protein DdX_18935 [Ditylenchus destructor]
MTKLLTVNLILAPTGPCGQSRILAETAAAIVNNTASQSLSQISAAATGLAKNDATVSVATSTITAAVQNAETAMDSAVNIAETACADQTAIDAANVAAVTSNNAAQGAATTSITAARDAAITAIQANSQNSSKFADFDEFFLKMHVFR